MWKWNLCSKADVITCSKHLCPHCSSRPLFERVSVKAEVFPVRMHFQAVPRCLRCIPLLKYQRAGGKFKACHPGSVILRECPRPRKWGWTLYPVALVVRVWVNTPEWSLYLEALAPDIPLLRTGGGNPMSSSGSLPLPSIPSHFHPQDFWSERAKLEQAAAPPKSARRPPAAPSKRIFSNATELISRVSDSFNKLKLLFSFSFFRKSSHFNVRLWNAASVGSIYRLATIIRGWMVFRSWLGFHNGCKHTAGLFFRLMDFLPKPLRTHARVIWQHMKHPWLKLHPCGIYKRTLFLLKQLQRKKSIRFNQDCSAEQWTNYALLYLF